MRAGCCCFKEANSRCHSSLLRNRSQNVRTLTSNQRKVDLICREYKLCLSSPCCSLLFSCCHCSLVIGAQPPFPLCASRTHQNCLCLKYSWYTLLHRGRSFCSRNGTHFVLELAALGKLWLSVISNMGCSLFSCHCLHYKDSYCCHSKTFLRSLTFRIVQLCGHLIQYQTADFGLLQQGQSEAFKFNNSKLKYGVLQQKKRAEREDGK